MDGELKVKEYLKKCLSEIEESINEFGGWNHINEGAKSICLTVDKDKNLEIELKVTVRKSNN